MTKQTSTHINNDELMTMEIRKISDFYVFAIMVNGYQDNVYFINEIQAKELAEKHNITIE